MRILNDLMIDGATVALSETSAVQEIQHMYGLDLMAYITAANPSNKTFTTVDQTANTATVTAHGFSTGMKFTLTTSGGLPTGLSPATDYYAIVVDADTIKFASSQANALAGTAIDLTGAGTGTQTVVVNTTIAGSVKLQKSDDPSSVTQTWFDITSSSQNFSGSTTLNWAYADVAYPYIRAVVTVTSGTVTTSVRINGKGA
jgi:hypothetical protein